MTREALRLLAVQGGPIEASRSLAALEHVDAWLEERPADLVVLSELATTAYFPTSPSHVTDVVGSLDGMEVARATAVAVRHEVVIAISFAAETAPKVVQSIVMFVGPDGPIAGRVISGPRAGAAATYYAKVHLSENVSANPGVHEKLHFRPGDGFVSWNLGGWEVAPLVCYDRSFDEAWRVLAQAGVDVVAVPIATSRPERVRTLEAELFVASMHHGMYAVAACKAGTESWDGAAVTYSGGTMVAGPDGSVISRSDTGPWTRLSAVLDRARLERYPTTFHYARDRRPSAYATSDPVDRIRVKEDPHG